MEWNPQLWCHQLVCQMPEGFKQRFVFRINGCMVVEMEIPHSENQMGRLTNYVYIPHKDGMGPSQLLQTYAKPMISENNSSRFKLPPKFLEEFSQKLAEQQKVEEQELKVEEEKKEEFNLASGFLNKQRIIEKLSQARQTVSLLRASVEQDESFKFVLQDEEKKAEEIEHEFISVYSSLEQIIKQKWVYSISDNPVMYIVDSLKAEEEKVVLRHLFDKNEIKLIEGKTEFITEVEFINELHILSQVEKEYYLREQIKLDHMLRIQYKVLGEWEEKLKFEVVQFEPRRVPRDDYHITFDPETGKIIKVSHTVDGDVEFQAQEIKQKEEDENPMIEVFTAVYRPMVLNVIHIHANYFNQDDGIQIETVADEKETKDHYRFKNQEKSGGLKIIVQNMKILRVLGVVQNQIEELKFREVRITSGQLCRLKEEEQRILKIEHIPVGILTTADNKILSSIVVSNRDKRCAYPVSHECGRNGYGGLNGEIDVLMISEQGHVLFEKEIPTSLSICNCSMQISELTKARIKSLYEEKQRVASNSISGIQKILRIHLEKYESLRKINSDQEELEVIYQSLMKGHSQLHALLDEKEEEMSQTEQDEIKKIDTEVEKALMGLAAQRRMSAIRERKTE